MFALDVDPSRLALAEAAGAVGVDVRGRNAEMALASVTEGRAYPARRNGPPIESVFA